tara:strand:- start:364 stop:615 length:252 start_codon:yes stop_codon:yes gene_type:complete
MNPEIEQILNDLENDINAISIESYTGGYEDRENALETLNKLKLKLFSIPVAVKSLKVKESITLKEYAENNAYKRVCKGGFIDR